MESCLDSFLKALVKKVTIIKKNAKIGTGDDHEE